MKLSSALLGLAAVAHSINAVAVPDDNAVAIDARTPESEYEINTERSTNEELWKRKGGGGGGGRGGGSPGRGGGGGGGGGGRPPGLGSPSSNAGGRTTTGTGPRPMYGGYYGGGAMVPYKAGGASRGIVPGFVGGAALGGLGLFGLAYLHSPGAYLYPYAHHYYYHNATTDMNETKPVVCVCQANNVCTCEDNGDQVYFNEIIGNGTYEGLNHTLITITKNETTGNLTIYINGEVPNGTTASGGDVEPSAANSILALAQAAGWWPAATMAFALAFVM